MKNILKYLTSLSFVILFLPFFDMCSSGNSNEPETKEYQEDSIQYSENDVDSMKTKEEADSSSDQFWILNGYEMGMLIFDKDGEFIVNHEMKLSKISGNLKSLTRSDLTNPLFIASSLFSILIFLLILVFIYALRDKIQIVKNFTAVNLVLVLLSIVLLVYGQVISGEVEISRFKIGYYILTLNLIAILYVIKKKLYNGNQELGSISNKE